jgi:hypothetical protein
MHRSNGTLRVAVENLNSLPSLSLEVLPLPTETRVVRSNPFGVKRGLVEGKVMKLLARVRVVNIENWRCDAILFKAFTLTGFDLTTHISAGRDYTTRPRSQERCKFVAFSKKIVIWVVQNNTL